MTYDEAMARFGHDAPDLRYGMEIVDCTDLAGESQFRVFQEVVGTADAAGHQRQRGGLEYSRRVIDELTEYVKHDFAAKGLAWFRAEDDGKLWSPIAKNFDDSWLAGLGKRMGAEPGDLLLLVADRGK